MLNIISKVFEQRYISSDCLSLDSSITGRLNVRNDLLLIKRFLTIFQRTKNQ